MVRGPARRSVLRRFATRWDFIVLARAAAVTLLALALAWLIAALSEDGIGWGERAGHALPFAPLCGAIGVCGALGPVRARGEAGALEALGRTPGQVGAAAVAGATIATIACAVVIGLVPAVDVAGFYPTARHASTWHFVDGRFEDSVHGLRIGPEGAPERLVTTAPEPKVRSWAIARPERAAASLATAFAALALSLIAARMLLVSPAQSSRKEVLRGHLVDAAACGLAIASSAVLFQVAAARHAPALSAAAPMFLLLGFSVKRYRDLS